MAEQTQKKPNILVIWGDDIGQSNLSCYSKGMMGYKTPNIDRIANEGMIFTDYYAEQSCTAGRAAFIMGQSVFRSGLSKVGLPGAAAAAQTLSVRPRMMPSTWYLSGSERSARKSSLTSSRGPLASLPKYQR